MNRESLRARIDTLKRQRDAVILAHNYQRPQVQDVADYLGDSLDLARIAARTNASVVVFCGVRFMAETAAILAPEKIVLLPVAEAGCPLADMVTAEQVRRFRVDHHDAQVVCYVNTSAAVKAESDLCCTSANAVSVVGFVRDDHPVLFVPDRNLGHHAARLNEREITLWNGWCPTHNTISLADVRASRRAHPRAELLAHPECPPEVLSDADHVAGTSGMLTYAGTSEAEEFIVATEIGMVHRLRKAHPEKQFYAATDHFVCPTMKMTTLDHVLRSLEQMTHVVTVPPETRERARRSIAAMLAAGEPTGTAVRRISA
jgi:quinolinate synthase